MKDPAPYELAGLKTGSETASAPVVSAAANEEKNDNDDKKNRDHSALRTACLAVEVPFPIGKPYTAKTMSQLQPILNVRKSAEAVDFYRRAFEAKEIYRVGDDESGVVSTLRVGDSEFWVAEEAPDVANPSPDTVHGTTCRLILVVPDPHGLMQKAVAAGGKLVYPVEEEHGWLSGRLVDPYGHHWELGRPLS